MNALLAQFTMTQLGTAIRGVLLWLLGILATNGYLKDDETQTAATALTALILLGYGVWKRRKDGLIASTAKIGTVANVVTDEATANRIPSAKVVPPSVTVPPAA